jgi:pre-mRNA-processing factor 19
VDSSGTLAIVGGIDGTAGIYSLQEGKLLQALKSGGGAITDALWWGKRAVIATATGVIRVMDGVNEVSSFASHAGSVTAVALHPSSEILASVGVDKSYVYYDLSSGKAVSQTFTDSGMS